MKKIFVLFVVLLFSACGGENCDDVEDASCGEDDVIICSQVDDWDECVKIESCEPVMNFQYEGYDGPAWDCTSNVR